MLIQSEKEACVGETSCSEMVEARAHRGETPLLQGSSRKQTARRGAGRECYEKRTVCATASGSVGCAGRTGTSTTSGRSVCRGHILLRTRFEVGLVPAAALETKTRCRHQLDQVRLTTFRTNGQGRVTHLLHGLKFMTTIVAAVFIERHGGNLGKVVDDQADGDMPTGFQWRGSITDSPRRIIATGLSAALLNP